MTRSLTTKSTINDFRIDPEPTLDHVVCSPSELESKPDDCTAQQPKSDHVVRFPNVRERQTGSQSQLRLLVLLGL